MNEQSNGNPFDKAALRKAMTKLRDGISSEERSVRSAAACRYVSEWMKEQEVESFMCYVPFRSELDTRTLVEWGWETGREVIVPKCYPADRSMTLHKLDSWSGLKAGAYGIMEPDPIECPPLPDAYVPKLVITPGLAFDSKGGRLGYGGGYYDRFAERLRNERGEASQLVKWFGIAFEDQLVEEIPMQAHDKRMNGIVTELMVRVWSDGNGTDAF
ncbi:5-formyltetrahydrofolate cyclo-ligase [Paenibacillus catalpae]|uniref:5-formyltetrahydrofolate cyclo-ligase n=1 Tax=Paenibacillus catalpae TaxID=1045775 RepID=A0A1I2HFP0_9BACL|nr:5-formyltetrahydrofolate cyclo-ligase [Paenibacillus catalpae]SFF29085.1 5-formyltetrahydrofolate cyclo-ligase [Paenibacillus catalpae]